MLYKTLKLLTFVSSLSLIAFSCKKKETTWDTNNTLPLFKSKIGINNITKTTDLYTNVDSSLSLVIDELVYSKNIYNVQTPDTSIRKKFDLERLILLDNKLSRYITLSEINPSFSFLNGQVLTIPASTQNALPSQKIDASQFFETATLLKGYLDVTITNDLPVTVKELDFVLKNEGSGSVIMAEVFDNILPKTSSKKTVALDGKTITKDLLTLVNKLETLASSGPVLINTSKGVRVEVQIREMKIDKAIAVFPNQAVIDQNEGLVLDMGGPEIKTFLVKTGSLNIDITSTIQENITIDFEIPSATKNGKVIKRLVKLPSAANGSVNKYKEKIDMNGYLIDFRGKNPLVEDTVNTFHQILNVYLDSSGRKVPISINDSFLISYQLESLVPEYAIGYMGKTTENYKGIQPTTVFKGLSGSLQLQNFEAKLIVKNPIGVEGLIKFNGLEAKNKFTNSTVNLTGSVLNKDYRIERPINLTSPPTETVIPLNNGNSNISQFLSILPQEIKYDLDISTNPNGNTGLWTDFIKDNNQLEVYLRLTSGNQLSFNNITVRDTQKIDFSNITDLAKLKSIYFLLNVENLFPISAELELNLLDENYQKITSLSAVGNKTITALENPIYGKKGSISNLKLGLSKENMFAIKTAKYIEIKPVLLGKPGNFSLFNWQHFNVKCNTEFEYEIGFK